MTTGISHPLPSSDYPGVTPAEEQPINLADISHTTLDDAMGDISGQDISSLEIAGHDDHNHLNWGTLTTQLSLLRL